MAVGSWKPCCRELGVNHSTSVTRSGCLLPSAICLLFILHPFAFILSKAGGPDLLARAPATSGKDPRPKKTWRAADSKGAQRNSAQAASMSAGLLIEDSALLIHRRETKRARKLVPE